MPRRTLCENFLFEKKYIFRFFSRFWSKIALFFNIWLSKTVLKKNSTCTDEHIVKNSHLEKTFKASLLVLLWKNLGSLVENFQQFSWNCSLRVRRLILLTMFTVFSKFLDFELKPLNFMRKALRRVVKTGFYVSTGLFWGKIEVLVVFFLLSESEWNSFSLYPKIFRQCCQNYIQCVKKILSKNLLLKKNVVWYFSGDVVEFFHPFAEIYQQGCENCFPFLLKFVLRKQISRKNWRFFRVRHYWCRKVYPFVKTAFDLFIGTLCF